VLQQEPYRKNGQEIKLLANAKLDEVIEAIEEYFSNDYGKKTIEVSKVYNTAGTGTASKLAGLKFVKADKGVEFDISFVTYRPSNDHKKKSSKKSSSANPPEISLRFSLKKGLLLKFYKYIMLIDSLLNEQSFTFYK
jgi:hypothetical protein